jgi:hypothetical protein
MHRLDIAHDALIAQRVLQKRLDTKFVLNESALDDVWQGLEGHYALMVAGSRPSAEYQNVYFDTPQYLSLRAHHRGQRPRFKVRIRHHVDRAQSFLEIKEKRNTGRTLKHRKPIEFMQETLGPDDHGFIRAHAPVVPEELVQSMRIAFQRVSLVGIHTDERLTIDTALTFMGEALLAGAVIAEVKQQRFRPRTAAMLALRGAGALKLSVSKYCTAAQLMVPGQRLPRYRLRLRMLRRRCNG